MSTIAASVLDSPTADYLIPACKVDEISQKKQRHKTKRSIFLQRVHSKRWKNVALGPIAAVWYQVGLSVNAQGALALRSTPNAAVFCWSDMDRTGMVGEAAKNHRILQHYRLIRKYQIPPASQLNH